MQDQDNQEDLDAKTELPAVSVSISWSTLFFRRFKRLRNLHTSTARSDSIGRGSAIDDAFEDDGESLDVGEQLAQIGAEENSPEPLPCKTLRPA